MPRNIAVMIFLFAAGLFAGDSSGTGGRVPVPPLSNGGIAGLWYREHDFLEKEYGAFELLNYSNTGYSVKREAVTDSTWHLTVMGNFTGRKLQYATLARPEKITDSTLLILFEWADPEDTLRNHGILYHGLLPGSLFLLRTRQSGTGKFDTLEISCQNMQSRCVRIYADEKTDRFKLVSD